MKSIFSKALQNLYLILLFEKIENQAPLAQLVSELAQETKKRLCACSHPRRIFCCCQKQSFFYFIFHYKEYFSLS